MLMIDVNKEKDHIQEPVYDQYIEDEENAIVKEENDFSLATEGYASSKKRNGG